MGCLVDWVCMPVVCSAAAEVAAAAWLILASIGFGSRCCGKRCPEMVGWYLTSVTTRFLIIVLIDVIWVMVEPEDDA